MATRHGTRHRYNVGCRCDDCKAANAAYRRRYRQGQRSLSPVPIVTPDLGVVNHYTSPTWGDSPRPLRESQVGQINPPANPIPGPVETGVLAEIGSAAEARPGLAQTALALARLMDDPKAVNQKPAAAKALTSLLDKLHQAGAPGRRGHLAVVRTMTKNGGA